MPDRDPERINREADNGAEDIASVRHEHAHAARIRTGRESRDGASPSAKRRRRRGPAAQEPKRHAEREVRKAVVAFCRTTGGAGLSWQDRSALLGMSDRTLRHWDHSWDSHRLESVLRGRPLIRSLVDTRNELLETLDTLGRHVGVPTLLGLDFPMGRRELEDFVLRYKTLLARWERQRLHVLHWLVPGTVWAIDHAEAPEPVDGTYPDILALRDLASGQQLEWLPVTDQTAETTTGVLRDLFHRLGPPLVLKSDRGSGFIAQETKDLLADWEVTSLLSPPRTPQYNGSVEAGIGSTKTRTRHEASRRGTPEAWTCDDCHAALEQANRLSPRPHLGGRTPQEVWEVRPSISAGDRAQFRLALDHHREEALEEFQARHPHGPGLRDQQMIERTAVTRTLVAGGYLHIRRRSVSLPLQRRFAARIS